MLFKNFRLHLDLFAGCLLVGLIVLSSGVCASDEKTDQNDEGSKKLIHQKKRPEFNKQHTCQFNKILNNIISILQPVKNEQGRSAYSNLELFLKSHYDQETITKMQENCKNSDELFKKAQAKSRLNAYEGLPHFSKIFHTYKKTQETARTKAQELFDLLNPKTCTNSFDTQIDCDDTLPNSGASCACLMCEKNEYLEKIETLKKKLKTIEQENSDLKKENSNLKQKGQNKEKSWELCNLF